MKPYVIMADATCDLGEELQKQYDIRVIPSHIMLPDGRDIPSFHKWEEFSRDQFYRDLKANPEGFATAPPNVPSSPPPLRRPRSRETTSSC